MALDTYLCGAINNRGGTGISLPNTGGVSGTVLNYYEEFSQAITFSWTTSGSATPTVSFRRIGTIVTLYIPNFSFVPASVASVMSSDVGSVPSRFLPAQDAYAANVGYLYYSGTLNNYVIIANVYANGSIILNTVTNGSATITFPSPATATVNVNGFSMTYSNT